MGTRSLLSGPHSKSTPDRRLSFGHVGVKREFQIKKEAPEDEIKEYAETAMNELLGWYGYDKLDSRDTQGLNLHHFSATKTIPGRRSPSDADSSDPEGTRNAGSPGRRNGPGRGSPSLPDADVPPAGCIVCSWCNKIVSQKMFSMKTPHGEKSFCSESCFTQCRRANFKRNKTCDWCRHIRHTVNYVDFQDGEHQLQFCSDKCLNQYKMNIFCKETEAHLQLHPHLQGLGATGSGSGNPSLRLITPELWLRDCRSESPVSDGSASPNDNSSSPIEIKVVMRPPQDSHAPLKPPGPSLEITKIDRRDGPKEKSRKINLLPKSKRQGRCSAGGGERRGSASSPRSADPVTPQKPPLFPPPLLPIAQNQISHFNLNPHPALPPDHAFLRPPFLPLAPFPPSHTFAPEHPLRRPPHPNEPIIRPFPFSPPSPSAPPPSHNQPPRPPGPPLLPPPKSLLPPVTILVPYPIALAIPIPLPIPIPIPLLSKKAGNEDDSQEVISSRLSSQEDPLTSTAPRPLRKRRRVGELLLEKEEGGEDEEEEEKEKDSEGSISKRKTVPV